MASPTYTVPSTATYYDRFTGVGYRLTAGDVITLRRAWLLQVPGASEPTHESGLVTAITNPQDGDALVYDAASGLWINGAASGGGGGGVATIHNYFPDGAISDDALIDPAGVDGDYDTHLWQTQGNSTLSFSAGTGPGGANEVGCAIVGWNDGVQVADWSNHYGCKVLPAGRYRIGVTLRADIDILLTLQSFGLPSDPEFSAKLREWVGGVPRRFVLDTYLPTAMGIGLLAVLYSFQYPGEDVPVGTVYLSHLMITEGDPALFRDGASAGWSWSGTPHASASSGPQP